MNHRFLLTRYQGLVCRVCKQRADFLQEQGELYAGSCPGPVPEVPLGTGLPGSGSMNG